MPTTSVRHRDLLVHPLERVRVGYDKRDARLPGPTPHRERASQHPTSGRQGPFRTWPRRGSRRVTITRRPITTALARRGGSPALPPPLLPAVPSSICRRRISREATSVTEFAQGDAVQRVRIGRRASRLATTKARRRIPTKTTGAVSYTHLRAHETRHDLV